MLRFINTFRSNSTTTALERCPLLLLLVLNRDLPIEMKLLLQFTKGETGTTLLGPLAERQIKSMHCSKSHLELIAIVVNIFVSCG